MGNFTIKGKSEALKGKMGMFGALKNKILGRKDRFPNSAPTMVPSGATGHTNPQRERMQGAIKKTFNKQKTFGVPGAK